jgi:ribonuclease P protein component
LKKQFTLGKGERLKSRKLIERLFREGKTIAASPLKLYYLIDRELFVGANQERAKYKFSNLQFGIGVGTKFFRKAVDRNRVKRVVRESYRQQKNALLAKAKERGLEVALFFIYSSKELPEFRSLNQRMEVILNKVLAVLETKADGRK